MKTNSNQDALDIITLAAMARRNPDIAWVLYHLGLDAARKLYL